MIEYDGKVPGINIHIAGMETGDQLMYMQSLQLAHFDFHFHAIPYN